MTNKVKSVGFIAIAKHGVSTIGLPVVILNAGPFRQEITEDIINNINTDTEFWE